MGKKVEAIAALEREREREREREKERREREKAHDLTSSLISIEARHSHKSQRERERQRVFSCHQFYFLLLLVFIFFLLLSVSLILIQRLLEVLEVMTGSAEDRPEAIESPSLGIPVVEIENPVTTRSESASLLKKGSGSRGKSKSRSGRYSIADEEEVSDALLQMVEQGGLRSHATNVVYRYNGKKCSLLKVSGNDYAKVVQELAKHRRHARCSSA